MNRREQDGRDDLARVIQAHTPGSTALCRIVADAVLSEWLPSHDAEVLEVAAHRLALLQAVVSYDNANQSDLPLGLLDSIRAALDGTP